MNIRSNRLLHLHILHLIREIRTGDWPLIAQIQDACYPAEAREQVETLQCHWQVAPQFCFVAETGGKVIAYFFAHPWPKRVPPPIDTHYSEIPKNADSMFIHDLALLPEARGTGLATLLVKHLFEVSSLAGFSHHSLISVQGTLHFWKKLGFSEVNNLPAGYFDALEKYYPGGGFTYMESVSH